MEEYAEQEGAYTQHAIDDLVASEEYLTFVNTCTV